MKSKCFHDIFRAFDQLGEALPCPGGMLSERGQCVAEHLALRVDLLIEAGQFRVSFGQIPGRFGELRAAIEPASHLRGSAGIGHAEG